MADERVDLVLLEQERDALDVAVDAFVLEFHHRRQIELRARHLDAHLGEAVACLLVELGGIQQRLRRNAADIQAGAAEGLVLLDHRDLEAELRRADRADIAAGAGADDCKVVGGHEELREFFTVMPGLVPGIHVFLASRKPRRGWPGQARP
jgi:hypothetical protein